jgi:hypothetical protein
MTLRQKTRETKREETELQTVEELQTLADCAYLS